MTIEIHETEMKFNFIYFLFIQNLFKTFGNRILLLKNKKYPLKMLQATIKADSK